MNLYEFNPNEKFNRGKLLINVKYKGTPCRIGYLGNVVVHGSIFIRDDNEDVELKPINLGVKAFMFSQKIINYQAPDTWETIYVGNVPGLKLDIPTYNGGEPMVSKEELLELGIS